MLRTLGSSGSSKLKRLVGGAADDDDDKHRDVTIISQALAMASKMTWSHLERGPCGCSAILEMLLLWRGYCCGALLLLLLLLL
jgi:hypothetical protein